MPATPYHKMHPLPVDNDTDETMSAAQYLWRRLQCEALHQMAIEPMLTHVLRTWIMERRHLVDALSFQLAQRLAGPAMQHECILELFTEMFSKNPSIVLTTCADIEAIRARDPACTGYLHAFLCYKGLHALESYRVCHALWGQGRRTLAVLLQNRISEVFSVDIHPAASLGEGIFMDHATGIVIGETAVVEDNVSILHEVTLGGTGKDKGDRHPKVRRGVLIGAGAKILGNKEIGRGANVGASSVVLDDVPAYRTVVGVPAKVVGTPSISEAALEMDHCLS